MARPPRIGPRWRPRDIRDPANWVGCEAAARQIRELTGGEVAVIRPKFGHLLGEFMGVEPGWHYHEVVVEGGRVYGPFTGHRGMRAEDYKRQWNYGDDLDFGF